MPLYIECPAGHRLKVPSKLAGLRIVCPVCNEGIDVPPLSPPPRFKAPTAVKKEPATKQHDSPSEELTTQSAPPTPPIQDEPAAIEQPKNKPVDSLPPVAPPQEMTAPAPPVAPPTAPPATPQVSPPSLDSMMPIDLPAESNEHALPSQQWQLDDGLFGDALPNNTYFDSEQEIIVVQETDEMDEAHSAQKTASGFLRGQHWGVMALGIASILIAVFCAIPAAVDQYNARQSGLNPPDTWTYLVLMGSVIQIAIAFYAIRLPDWTTSWMASIVATFFAAAYALALALTMFASQEHALVQSLGLLDEAFANKAQPWSALVLCVMLILAYSYGRFSLRWYKLDRQLLATRTRVA